MNENKNIEFTPDTGATSAAGGDVSFDANPNLERNASGGSTGSTGGYGASTSGGGNGVTDKAAQEAKGLMQKAKSQASSQVESRVSGGMDRAASALGSVSNALRTSSRELEGEERAISRYVDEAADQVERLSQYLRETEVSEIVDGVEGFARKRPGVFVGGAIVAGVLAARFLKASRRNVHTHDSYSGGVSGSFDQASLYDDEGVRGANYGSAGFEGGTGAYGARGTTGVANSGYAGTGNTGVGNPGYGSGTAGGHIPDAGMGGTGPGNIGIGNAGGSPSTGTGDLATGELNRSSGGIRDNRMESGSRGTGSNTPRDGGTEGL